MGKLDGKVALVTGAGSGIGAATARRFVEEGAHVLLVDRNENQLTALVAELGERAAGVAGDVAVEADNRRFFDAAIDAFGRLDIVVLNAGIEGEYGHIADLPVDAFDRVMAVNVRGVWLGLREAMPRLRGAGGSIVICSSIAGLRGSAGWAAYTTSKHAVIGMAKSAALEGAAHGIRVNTVNPAPVQTPMIDAIDRKTEGGDAAALRAARKQRIPLGRYGTTAEVAAMILFLAGDDASYCTAGSYLVDGGTMTG